MSQNPLTPDQVVGIIQDAKQAHHAVVAASTTAAISAFMALAVPMVRPPMWQGMTLFCAASALWHSQVLRGANQRHILADARKRALEGASQESLIYRVVEGVSPIQDPVQIVPQLSGDPVAAAIQQKWQAMKLLAQPLEPVKGFTFTRYRFIPNAELSADRFIGTGNDLKQVLRLEKEPIIDVAGGAIVVDVPNSQRVFPRFYEYVSFDQRGFCDPLELAVGVDLQGRLVDVDLSDSNTPHVLGGGTTGGGKSQLVRSMLLSGIARFTPEALRLIIIDFKGLDFTELADSPWTDETVTSSDRVLQVISDLKKDMLERYEAMQGIAANLLEYNAKVQNPLPRKILLIDEYSQMIDNVRDDLGNKAVEAIDNDLRQIGRLARASGIHLLIFTQKPLMRSPKESSGIPSGLKANLPARIALACDDHHSSKVILDSTGAENLLGKGDLLFNGQRLQSPDARDSGLFQKAIARYASPVSHPTASPNLTSKQPPHHSNADRQGTLRDSHPPVPDFVNDMKSAHSGDFDDDFDGCDELSDRELEHLMKDYARRDPSEIPIPILRQAVAYYDVRLGITGQNRFIEMFWGIPKSGNSPRYDRARTAYKQAMSEEI